MPCCVDGNPQKWEVSAFLRDGTLDQAWLSRLHRVLSAADKLGLVPIVQFFYHAQFPNIAAAAVPAAVVTMTKWLAALPLQNFLVEVFNEKCGDKPITSLGLTIADLIGIVHNTSEHKILTSASCGGGGIPSPSVVSAADFVLLHGNGQQPAGIRHMLKTVKSMPAFTANPKPIVFNEDDHGNLAAGSGDSNMGAAIDGEASWGFLCCCSGKVQGDYSTGFQCPPVNWAAAGKCLGGSKGDPMPYASKTDFKDALQRYSKQLATIDRSISKTTGELGHRIRIAPGVYMPAVSNGAIVLGTDDSGSNVETQALSTFFANGGRGVDTAWNYNNQVAVGWAVNNASATVRSALFVTTKIPCVGSAQAALNFIQDDLGKLNVTSVDLVLIHSPGYGQAPQGQPAGCWGFPRKGHSGPTNPPAVCCANAAELQATWRGLEIAHARNLTRAIG